MILFEFHQNIRAWLYHVGIEKYALSQQGEINVYGSVDLSGRGMTRFPFKFGFIEGDFYCNNNLLTSLENGPSRVDGLYDCSNNKLVDLIKCSESVGSLNLEGNTLETFEGFPQKIKEYLVIRGLSKELLIQNQVIFNNIEIPKGIVMLKNDLDDECLLGCNDYKRASISIPLNVFKSYLLRCDLELQLSDASITVKKSNKI